MKRLFTLLMLCLLSLLVPVIAFAADENPITKIKQKMGFNWKVLDGLDFIFSPVMIAVTLLLIGLLIFSVIGIITHLWKIKRAKASLSDKKFWIESLFVVVMVFLFVSGGIWGLLEQIYNWTSNQDIGETTTQPQTTGMVNEVKEHAIKITWPV
ncbi:hypothetical protein [Paenibacillus mesotrionivorans]|uniref:Uncharacterized protein n=1 Tax=Paenibacillus mesotrionivorans TaxID=3160968 RepID=A0ACC7P160_9BACL